VVVAFGMEQQERENYLRYLNLSKKQGIKSHFMLALIIALLWLVIYCCYAYAFWISSLFVEKQIFNTFQNRVYTAGDALPCFFGVLIGLFSLAGLSPSIKAVNEGKVAGKFISDVIERMPTINQDNDMAKTIEFDGSIEFEEVDFYYPSRPEAKVLDNFSARFERGKTTAICGPSGAGKSSIV
jgi:ATP-binding cassette, subfamily B (MDR/TAP), member 1